MKQFSTLAAFLIASLLNAQETYWGMTSNGAQSNAGSIYTITSAGVFTKKYDFKMNEGISQRSELLKASNGKYYGVTLGGGNSGLGTLFSYDPGTGVYTVLVNFTSTLGSQPERGLVQFSGNGLLYGVCRGGGTNSIGTLFEFNTTTNTITKRHNFASTTGSTPRGRLYEFVGRLWGVTQAGGTGSAGIIYDFDPATNITTRRYSMTTANGSAPATGVIQGFGGLLYGTTQTGGTNGLGTIYSFNTSTFAYTRLYSFALGNNGNTPYAELVEPFPGTLCGSTTLGGPGNVGILFKYNTIDNTYVRLWSFVNASGQTCYSRMSVASNGLMYGMTNSGGTSNKGVIFTVDTLGTYSALYNLNSSSIGLPFAGLTEDPPGSLNATCSDGGDFALGALFRYNIAGNSVNILAHMGASDGAFPWGRLTRASNGLFYGLTSGGGSSNSGVLFSYDPTGLTYTKLVDFGSVNGRYPFGRMALVGNTLYGLCSQGGTSNLGTLFSYDIGTSTFTVKKNLTAATGTGPQAGMIVASNGKLYGTCAEGGTSGFGTIFDYVPGTNTLTVLRQLIAADGTTPQSDMVQASDGNLYGTLSEAGSFAGGSVYRIAPATGVFTRVGDFDAGTGTNPSGDMAEISGVLYGTASSGGANTAGTIFSFTIATGVVANVHDLTTAEGSSSEAGLLLGSDGKLYGTCASGGSASSLGTVMRFDPVALTVTALRTLGVNDGFYPRDGVVKETIPPSNLVQLNARVMLEGPYNSGTLIMADALRTLGDFPLTEPYTGLGFPQAGGGGGETTTAPVLAVTGNNAIVDWVRVELRSSSDPTTILATKQCLVQRDGDIVSTDGVSAVSISIAPASYYVAVRHRNHLSVMTSAAIALSASPVTVDFTLTSTTTYGTTAQKTIGTVNVLWAGNTLRDSPAPWLLKYTGSSNDRDPILSAIGGVVPTNTITDYRVEDVNLDGVTKYTGAGNDRDFILANIGGVVPTNTKTDQLP